MYEQYFAAGIENIMEDRARILVPLRTLKEKLETLDKTADVRKQLDAIR